MHNSHCLFKQTILLSTSRRYFIFFISCQFHNSLFQDFILDNFRVIRKYLDTQDSKFIIWYELIFKYISGLVTYEDIC